MMSTIEHLRILERVLSSLPLFRELSNDDAARVEAQLRPQFLGAGEALMREGDAGSFFAIVVAGLLAIARRGTEGPEDLGIAGTGSIVGELGLLRNRARAATVTAVVPSHVLVGDRAAFESLLTFSSIHEYVRHLASTRLAANARPTALPLRDGATLVLRPLLPTDRAAYVTAVRTLSAESLRRRFFSGGLPSDRVLEYLIDIDYVDHFAWAVLDPEPVADGSLVAAARYIRHADNADLADLAFGVADAYQGRGIATLLFGALGVAAEAAGIHEFDADVLSENASMRAVFAKAGAKATFGGTGVVHVTLPVAAAAALLGPALRRDIEVACRDVVTAAGLALTHHDD